MGGDEEGLGVGFAERGLRWLGDAIVYVCRPKVQVLEFIGLSAHDRPGSMF